MNIQEKTKQARKLLIEARNDLVALLQKDRSRQRGAIVRELHVLSIMLGEGGSYFSQAGQDRVIDRLLQEKTGGVFADIGGYDGVTGSNSLFFEVFRGWSGILVEPSPTQLRKAEQVRRCPCLGYAVAGEAADMAFMEITEGYTQMSGFLDSYDRDLLTQVRGDARHKEVIHQLQAKPLADILTEAGLSQIDYLSLDVEGGEMDILQSFPFDSFDIEFWSIENNNQSSQLPELMQDRGYDLIEFAGVDDLFRKRRKGK